MLPIVQTPEVVAHFAPHFKSVFNDESDYTNFQRYLSGLIVSENKTVQAINRHFVVQIRHQVTLNRFLTDSSYDWKTLNSARLAFLQNRPQTCFKTERGNRGVLSIDDTLLTHYGENFEGIANLRDPHKKSYHWAHNLISLYYSDDWTDYPVYQLLWQPPDIEKLVGVMETENISLNDEKRTLKETEPKLWKEYILGRYRDKQFKHPKLAEVYKTKLWLARDLIEEFISNYPEVKIPFCFDRWYTKPMLCDYLTERGQSYVGLLESKVLVWIKGQKIRVSQLAQELKKQHLEAEQANLFHKVKVNWRGQAKHYYAYCKTHNLPAFGKVRLVISYRKPDLSDEPYLLICNQHTWRPAGILNVYRRRWPVEVYHEEGKAEGLDKYQIRPLQAIYKHIACVNVVYSLLHAARYDQVLISNLQQQLHQDVKALVNGSVAHWRRVVKAQTLLNFVAWVMKNDPDRKDWKALLLPIIHTMTY